MLLDVALRATLSSVAFGRGSAPLAALPPRYFDFRRYEGYRKPRTIWIATPMKNDTTLYANAVGFDSPTRFTTSSDGQPLATDALSPLTSLSSSRPKQAMLWLLDPSRSLAARLAHDGDPESITSEETDTSFKLAWPGNCRLVRTGFRLHRSSKPTCLNHPRLSDAAPRCRRSALKFQIYVWLG